MRDAGFKQPTPTKGRKKQRTKDKKREEEERTKERLNNNADAEMVGHSPNDKLGSSSQLFQNNRCFYKKLMILFSHAKQTSSENADTIQGNIMLQIGGCPSKTSSIGRRRRSSDTTFWLAPGWGVASSEIGERERKRISSFES